MTYSKRLTYVMASHALPRMALNRSHKTDGTMTVLMVVPLHKTMHPTLGLLQPSKPLAGKSGIYLQVRNKASDRV